MYFGKCRASRINLFWSRWISLILCLKLWWSKGSHIRKLVRHIVCRFVVWWMGWVPIFYRLKVWFCGTWCCSAPGYPQSVFASFRRSFCKSFAANCTFLLAAHRAVSSGNWDFEFCLWWGFGKSLTYIIKSNGLRTEPCGTPTMGLILSERKPFTLTWITQPTRKSESQCVILVGRSSIKILYLSPLCQTLSKAFSTSRKAATTCSPLLKLSITDWKSLKRWSSVDLFCLKPDWFLFMKPMSSR